MGDIEAGLRAWSHFLGASALVLRDIEARLKAAGQPSIGWYDVLLELERAGGRLRVHELAERLVIERYNATRLLDRMEAAGVIGREQASEDRRGTVVSITSEGLKQREKVWPHYRQAIGEAFGDALTAAEAASLTKSMKKLIAHHSNRNRHGGLH
jgi:DNA-binding MarR family transcriptional regulator